MGKLGVGGDSILSSPWALGAAEFNEPAVTQGRDMNAQAARDRMYDILLSNYPYNFPMCLCTTSSLLAL